MARGEPIWQTSSTGPTSMPELERGGGHQRPELAGPQARLDQAAARRREAAVVGGHLQPAPPRPRRGRAARPAGGRPARPACRVFTKTSVVRCPDVLGDPVQHLGELRVAGHRLELGGRELDGHVEVTAVAAVDDRRRARPVPRPRQQPGHHLERPLGGREPDALQPATALGHHLRQPLEGQSEVGAALVAGQGVDLVDDDRPHPAQHRPRGGRREQQVERLRRGHQQVGRAPAHGRPLGRRVSPVRTADREVGRVEPEVAAAWRMPASGSWRFSWTSAASARRGET